MMNRNGDCTSPCNTHVVIANGLKAVLKCKPGLSTDRLKLESPSFIVACEVIESHKNILCCRFHSRHKGTTLFKSFIILNSSLT